MARHPRIDEYIKNAAPFAQPILRHYRKLVHTVCPAVEEKWKWSFPNFDYKGAPLTHMAAFKNHCSIGFWKAALMKNNEKLITNAASESAMGHLGRITAFKDLPSEKVLANFIQQGMALNDAGISLERKPAKKAMPDVPDDLSKAFNKNAGTQKRFLALTPGKRREFITFITSAKREETRAARIQKTILLLTENKHLGSKYEK